MIVSRKWSNGILSRKKNDSFVVIASTTSIDERLGVRLRELGCTSSARPADAGLARDRQQPALDQVLLVRRQDEAGALLQELAQVIVIERRHGRPPANRRMTLGAI